MKPRELIHHVESHGFRPLREGSKHSGYFNPLERRTSTVPRHPESNRAIVRMRPSEDRRGSLRRDRLSLAVPPSHERTTSLIKSPWGQTFLDLIVSVQSDLLLVSPFIKSQTTREVVSKLTRRGVHESLRVVALTNLRPESAISGAMDLEALVELSRALPRFELTHLPGLHAKVYVSDERMAVVTSANLTGPGLQGNLEYGVALSEPRLVRKVRSDFEAYALLGARVRPDDVEELLNQTRELKALFRKAERSIQGKARRVFEQKLRATRDQLLRHRARGKTTQGMLCDAILFSLARSPLRTSELHPMVQQLHPDLCDDSIDRVIGGVHFGKKWKHHVRTAQQYLKRIGRVWYDGRLWHLVAAGGAADRG